MTLEMLLVEDDRPIANALQRDLKLERPNLVVHRAHRAQEGLNHARAFFAQHPNGRLFVFTDKDMPSHPGDQIHSGLELSQALRAEFRGRVVYIFLATGGQVPSDLSIDRAAQKTVPPKDILDALNEFERSASSP